MNQAEENGKRTFRPWLPQTLQWLNPPCFCHGNKQEKIFITDLDIPKEHSVCMLQDYFDKLNVSTKSHRMSMMGWLLSSEMEVCNSLWGSPQPRTAKSTEFIVYPSHLGTWNMSPGLYHHSPGWVLFPCLFIYSANMYRAYTMCPEPWWPWSGRACFLRKELTFLTGVSSSCALPLCQGLTAQAAQDSVQPAGAQWVLPRMPHVSPSTTFAVGLQGPRGATRRLCLARC